MKTIRTFLTFLLAASFLWMSVFAYAEDWYENLEALTPVKPHAAVGNVNKNCLSANVSGNGISEAQRKEMLSRSDASLLRTQQLNGISQRRSSASLSAMSSVPQGNIGGLAAPVLIVIPGKRANETIIQYLKRTHQK